ncbi:MAG: DEAD/DEAH box helicase [Planctomycetaceae bacterium]|jgi:superfamily II DNA or RNA helicase|nr:DEAD/DEAH box helicase [Planctomycetaceae bacterium]
MTDEIKSISNVDLLTSYLKQPEPAKSLLEYLAVYSEAIPVNRLVRNAGCFYISSVSKSQEALAELLQPYLQKLTDEKLIFFNLSAYQISPKIRELIVRRLVMTKRYSKIFQASHHVAGTEPMSLQTFTFNYNIRTKDAAIREGRNALISFDQTSKSKICDIFDRCSERYSLELHSNGNQDVSLLNEIFLPFNADWFKLLPEKYREDFFTLQLCKSLHNLERLDEKIEKTIQENILNRKRFPKVVEYPALYIQYLILRNEKDKLEIVTSNSGWRLSVLYGVHAVQSFICGNWQEAKIYFTRARQECMTETTSRNPVMLPLIECFHILYGFASCDTQVWQKNVYEIIGEKLDTAFWSLLEEVNAVIMNGTPFGSAYPAIKFFVRESNFARPFVKLIDIATVVWFNLPQKNAAIKEAESIAARAKENGYCWLAGEAAAMVQALSDERVANDDPAILYKIVSSSNRWDNAKFAIQSLKNSAKKQNSQTKDNVKTQRLTWRLTITKHGYVVEPYEQTRTKSGWTAGRKVALSRLYLNWQRMPFLSEQDKNISTQMKVQRFGYYGETEYSFKEDALLALVGHPLVFSSENAANRIEIRQSKPTLEITKSDRGVLLITIYPFPKDARSSDAVTKKIVAQMEGKNICRVFDFDNVQLKAAKIISPNGLPVPKDKEDEISQLLEPLIGDFQINAVQTLPQFTESLQNTETVEPDSRIFLRMQFEGNDLFVEPSVFPLGENSVAYFPGNGGVTVFGEQDGRAVVTQRNFALETQYLESLFNNCPMLNNAKKEGRQYIFHSLEDTFSFLETLPKIDQEHIIVQWIKPEKFHVSSTATFRNFKLRLAGGTDWFEASGQLTVDGLSVDLQTLLKSLAESPTRFVKINEKDYIALTEEFRRKLDEFRALTFYRGKTTTIHPLAVQAVERTFAGLTNTAGTKNSDAVAASIKTDAAWKKMIKRFQDAENYEPKLPKTFQGDMRDYQQDGFIWLAQLAAWGAGACLADDMGLGKTIQALALLLLRKNEGAALVVAPTSVCENWEREAARFAPILNIKRIQAQTGQAADDYKEERAKIIKNAKKGDVIITNYSLMQIEQERLKVKKFATIILDEAQAIKNADTARTQTAFSLSGDFKVVMTGTPIENHLGEFWSLFNFINPGFLGTRQEFERRYMSVVSNNNSEGSQGSEELRCDFVRQHLKSLVRPFILRRTKSEVLSELPPKTEIRLDVELSKEEALLYETIRCEALRKIESAKEDNVGTQHLRVLAELMRLRRTCCHSELVLPTDSGKKIPCSKLDLLEDVVREMLENNHKALVFSQFVDYLKLIAVRLDAMKVTYQYLDGSMTQAKRQKAIDAFQAGESDLFLISLKAGGSGLNLTAADYVIHMDPWWNPAVENQATDRAHRIGQQRPVTIYRMITKGTIEEKIVELHQQKEALAQEILDGTDTPTKFSLEQLMNILKN